MIVEIGWQLVSIHSHVSFRTPNAHRAPLLYASLSCGTCTSTGPMLLMAVSQGRQNLLFLYFCALRHKMQPLSPHLESASVGRLPRINNPTIRTHDLWVFRQYFPALPFVSLYTGLLHPGVAQIPDIPEAEDDQGSYLSGKLR